MTDPALSFGSVADAYHRGRPTYPDEAVAWLTESPKQAPLSVLELGAGTGKLTQSLVRAGHDVLATDPDADMLAVLQRHLPDVRTAVAGAEQIPAPDMTFDVVVAGQAYHWFDTEKALPEIARVLKPGGTIALAWNQRDERIPWVRRLGDVIGKHVETADPSEALLDSGHFAAIETFQVKFWQVVDRESIVDLVISRSTVASLSPEEREAKRAEVLAFYDDFGRGMDGMQLPYTTHCFRAMVTDKIPVRRPAPEAPPLLSADRNGMNDTAQRLPKILDEGGADDTGTLLIDFR
jgi:SAM-dependent methyltransferase